MIFHLNKDERKLLQDFNIDFRSDFDYSDEEAFALLDQVHDAEIFYAQDSDTNGRPRYMANFYADLADKIQSLIPG